MFAGINARLRRSPTTPNGLEREPQAESPEESRQSASPRTPVISSPSTPSSAPFVPPVTGPRAGQSAGQAPTGDELLASYRLPAPKPLWLNAAHAKHIVKGNFMTLSARPKTVDMGEWVAHQVVEHWRTLITFIRLVHDKEADGYSVCNPGRCPKMSAGPNHSFTWLNSRLEPCEIPAHEYLSLVQRYVTSKIDDPRLFPTDPAGVSFADGPALGAPGHGAPAGGDWVGRRSGFPRSYAEVCQTIFRQMFRVYAHLYWAHFEDPMYHLGVDKAMNSCFSHFLLTATTLDLLRPADLEPVQPLLDLWAALGTFPRESRAYAYANLQAGRRLLQLAGVAP